MQLVGAIAVSPARSIGGRLHVPGDKSISHRYALLSALADGTSEITNYAPGADCRSTLDCINLLGATVAWQPGADGDATETVIVRGRGVGGLQPPDRALDCGNSGSTMRMLSGIVAAHPFRSELVGDGSLSKRPMRRVMAPLRAMGASIDASEGDRPPLVIQGAQLQGITFAPDVPSAQVKSAVLLAGLHAHHETRVTEPATTRDHTERAFAAFGVSLNRDGRTLVLSGHQRLRPMTLKVPGDLSSAAFMAVAAAALPGSDLTIEGVGLNPTRSLLVEILRRAGALVETHVDDEWQGEPVGRVRIRHRALDHVVITPEEVPEVIDELPVLAALGTFGGSVSVSGAQELRDKESDRIASLVGGLRAMGADADERPDGFTIRASRRLTGATVHAHHDHRLAMAFAIAALGASDGTTIEGADAVAVSYPGFFADLRRVVV
jgi:3-phosphoshikimate 1-carboxyvinyltransferase